MPAGNASGSDLDFSNIPTLKAAAPQPATHARSPSPKALHPTFGASSKQRTLTDAEVLKVLESRRAGTALVNGAAGSVAVLPPEDTNTRLVLREAVARNAPVFFAVQLQWSVQPIEVKSVPKDAIFSAYSLYAAEGRRTGRTWFFIRLGFFSDSASAKQVAHYLRRNFASAAVVPVSPQEREQVRQMGRSENGTVARSPGR